MAENATVAFGFKPTRPDLTKPLCDVTGHYLLTITKIGTMIRVWKNNCALEAYTGVVGTTYAELVTNVLIFYSGSSHGYYSSLRIVEDALDYTAFLGLSDMVTGLWVPKSSEGMPLHTHLDFTDGNSSAIVSVEGGWSSEDIGANSVSNNYTVFDQTVEIPAGTTVTALKVWTDGTRATSNARVGIYRQTGAGKGTLVSFQKLTIGTAAGFCSVTLETPFLVPSDGFSYRMCVHTDRCVSCTTAAGQGGDAAGNLVTAVGAELVWTNVSWRAPIMQYEGTKPAGLGLDVSGSGNHWILNDAVQTTDTPTNNYCVLNPLSPLDNGTVSYGNGNLVRDCTAGAGEEWSSGTFVLPRSGKWAWRVHTTAMSGTHAFSGVMKVDGLSGGMVGQTNDSWGGSVAVDTSLPSTGIIMYDAGLRQLRIMRDGAPSTIWNNGVSMGPVAVLPDGNYVPVFGKHNGPDTLWSHVSFGSEDSSWLPAGYLPLCSDNLPMPRPMESATVADILLRMGEGEDAGLCLVDCAAGTAIGSSWKYYSDGDLSKAFNDVIDTSERLANYGPVPMIGKVWDSPKCITRARWYGVFDYGITYQHQVREIQLQGSNDGTSWVTLGTLTITDDKVATIDYAGSAAFLQHRMRIPAAANDTTYILEAQFFTGEVGTTEVASLGFCPDFVSIKCRSRANRNWNLYDSQRGATKKLETNTVDMQNASGEFLKSFEPDGYTLGTGVHLNERSEHFVDFCLKAGGSQGFEIATFSHVEGVETDLVHGFGKPVVFAFIKQTDGTDPWRIYHASLGESLGLKFDTSAATAMSWRNSATAFGIPHDAPTGLYVAYLFTDSDVFKPFSYTGNGVTDGPCVPIGGRVLGIPFLKGHGTTGWVSHDTRRVPVNADRAALYPSTAEAEYTASTDLLVYTSQGFKITTPATTWNESGVRYVGLAVLESIKYSNAF
nr:hypothetical protein [uncultured Pseudodesulfovibrio sp.]